MRKRKGRFRRSQTCLHDRAGNTGPGSKAAYHLASLFFDVKAISKYLLLALVFLGCAEEHQCQDTDTGFRHRTIHRNGAIYEQIYTFDSAGRLSKYEEIRTYRDEKNWTMPDPKVVHIEYDSRGRVSLLSWEKDRRLEAEYDDKNRLTRILQRDYGGDHCMRDSWPCLSDGYLWLEFRMEYIPTGTTIIHVLRKDYKGEHWCSLHPNACTSERYLVTEYIFPETRASELQIRAEEPTHRVEHLTIPDDEICYLNWRNHVIAESPGCGGPFGDFPRLGKRMYRYGQPRCSLPAQ